MGGRLRRTRPAAVRKVSSDERPRKAVEMALDLGAWRSQRRPGAKAAVAAHAAAREGERPIGSQPPAPPVTLSPPPTWPTTAWTPYPWRRESRGRKRRIEAKRERQCRIKRVPRKIRDLVVSGLEHTRFFRCFKGRTYCRRPPSFSIVPSALDCYFFVSVDFVITFLSSRLRFFPLFSSDSAESL